MFDPEAQKFKKEGEKIHEATQALKEAILKMGASKVFVAVVYEQNGFTQEGYSDSGLPTIERMVCLELLKNFIATSE